MRLSPAQAYPSTFSRQNALQAITGHVRGECKNLYILLDISLYISPAPAVNYAIAYCDSKRYSKRDSTRDSGALNTTISNFGVVTGMASVTVGGMVLRGRCPCRAGCLGSRSGSGSYSERVSEQASGGEASRARCRCPDRPADPRPLQAFPIAFPFAFHQETQALRTAWRGAMPGRVCRCPGRPAPPGYQWRGSQMRSGFRPAAGHVPAIRPCGPSAL